MEPVITRSSSGVSEVVREQCGCTYRVFFIEGQTEISYEINKLLLFDGGFGLKIMVTTVQFISDHLKTYF